MKRIIDINEDYFEIIKHDVKNGQDYKPLVLIANSIPYEERPLGGKNGNKRPLGKWIEGKNGNIKCNRCGCEIRYSYLIGNEPDFPKFCIECGAKMVVKKDGK